MTKNYCLLRMVLVLLGSCAGIATATSNDTIPDSLAKKGWNLGVLPAVSFDSDLGFQYGGLVDAYNYGDGSRYPAYNHEVYVEVSRMTRGSAYNKVYYNSGKLFTRYRVSFEASYITDMAYPFYGFNGRQSVYNKSFTDETSDSYRSRMFYAYDRKLLRIEPVVVGNITRTLQWVGGLGVYKYAVSTVNIQRLNRGKADGKRLPDVPTLYDMYVDKGLILLDQSRGGWYNHFFGGLVHDTRPNPANPERGMMQELLVGVAPRFLANASTSVKLMISHRQFICLVPKRLTLAYRLSWTRNGSAVPWYSRQLLLKSRTMSMYSEGVGGSKTVRGIKMNRLLGQDFAYSNVELRLRVARSRIMKQNFYFVLSSFLDAALVTRFVPLDLSGFDETSQRSFFNDVSRDVVHQSTGAGLRTVMNENFIVALEYGRSLRASDGDSGFYITLNFLF